MKENEDEEDDDDDEEQEEDAEKLSVSLTAATNSRRLWLASNQDLWFQSGAAVAYKQITGEVYRCNQLKQNQKEANKKSRIMVSTENEHYEEWVNIKQTNKKERKK